MNPHRKTVQQGAIDFNLDHAFGLIAWMAQKLGGTVAIPLNELRAQEKTQGVHICHKGVYVEIRVASNSAIEAEAMGVKTQ